MKKERSSVLEYAQDPILLIKLRPGNIEQSKLLVSTVSHYRSCYHRYREIANPCRTNVTFVSINRSRSRSRDMTSMLLSPILFMLR